MKIKTLLLASAAGYLASAGFAHAEPVTIALFGAAFASTLAGTIVSTALTIGLSFGVSLLQKAMMPEQEPVGVSVNVSVGDDVPVSAIIGRYATAGTRVYGGTWGKDGKTPNAYLVEVVELGNLPCSGLNALWINEAPATPIIADEHAEYGYPIQEFRKGSKDYCWVKFYDGTQTTASSYLTSKFGSHPDRPFTADMIGRGCPYAIITSRFNQSMHQGAPQCVFELGSVKLYDIRKDTTNGGSGAHRWDNPATWEPSTNPVVLIYNIIRGLYYGVEWFYGGQNLAAFRLPSSSWIAGANECDVSISLSGGGSEAAFRAGYQIAGSERPLEAVAKIAKGCNARIAEVGGIFKILVGAPGSAVYSFTDDDILITEGQSFAPFPSLDDTINGIEATYPEPQERWASKDAPARYDAALETEDGDRRLPVSVAFGAVPYPNQVQRLMEAMLQDARRFRQHQFHLPPDAYALEPNDVVSWTSARNGYSSKKFIVTSITGAATMNQLVTLKEVDPSDYDWSSDLELPTAYGWTGTTDVPTLSGVDGWGVSPATIYDSASNARRPAIQVEAADDQDNIRNVRVQVRLKSSGAVVYDSDALTYEAPFEWILNGNFLPNTVYEVRGRLVPEDTSALETDWSAWLEVLTPNVKMTLEDVFVDVDLLGLPELIEEATDWISGGVRELIENVHDRIADVQDTSFMAFLDRQTIKREVTSNYSDLTAEFSELIFAATGPGSALVGRIDTIEASLGDVASASALSALTAEVSTIDGDVTSLANALTSISAGSVSGDIATANFRMTAGGSPGTGYAARIGMEARSGGAGTWRSASFFMDVPTLTSSPSRIVMMADQVIMTDAGGTLKRPFTYSGGVLYLDEVKANSLSAISASFGNAEFSGVVKSTGGGKLELDFTNGTISLYD